ncbi:MAG: hypothetical protein AAGH79_18220 [Bacteroidota bacterium]
MIYRLITLSFLLGFSTLLGCRKTLDLNQDVYLNIEDLLHSTNCAVPCGTVAECEGDQARIRGSVDAMNIMDFADKFYLLDPTDNDYRIEVLVDTSASAQVFSLIQNAGGQIALVEGVLDGYDAATGFSCDRQFVLLVQTADQVRLE